jgi:tRNA/rRNA methyltransferase
MITVVLVEPEGEENVGSTARAMMNMEADRLELVHPLCDHLSRLSLNHALHAGEILKNARVFGDLKSALQEADISAAITRRTGRWRKRDFILEDFSNYLTDYRNSNIKLIFGREKFGLTNEEIRLCDLVCSIPSSKNFPSINLAQAVMITLYDIYRTNLKDKKDKAARLPASREEFDTMLSIIISAFDEMDFFRNVPPWRLTNYIKKILIRAGLDSYDCLVIKNIFSRINGKFRDLKKQAFSHLGR